MPTARAQTVFVAAAEITDPAARAQFLAEACGGDLVLKARVEALLRAHDQPDSLLDAPLVSPPHPDHADTRAFPPDPDHASTRTSGGTSGDTEDDEALSFLTPSTRPDSLGRIGHYEVLQVLGRGAFGIVFRAFDDVLQRVVAVKVLAPQLAATSPARRRFLREARSSAAVRHENVVQVYEVGEQPLPYIVMEFIPGETLQQRLDRIGPVEPIEVVRIGRQIAEGLAAAHANDLIHRDIKPGNILLEGGAQRVKITDFGLARAADDASISQSGIIAGTPMYMAPEQAKGEKLDQRADLFSLGSVLYQMAAGRPPFRANSTVAVLKRVADDTPRDIREIIPETPQWLCDIIAKLHAKNPDDRYQSAREVADVLADCEAQLKAKQEVKNVLPAVVKPAAPTAPARSTARKWVAAAVLLLPVLALAVTEFAGVTRLFRGQQAPPDPTRPGGEPHPVMVEKKEPPVPVPVAKQEPLPPSFKNSIGMEFVIVPKGKSWLGGGKDKLGDQEVEIPADFYLGKYEVTQEEWEKVTGENPSHFSRDGAGKDAVKDIPDADLKRFPVENASWDQCQVFLAKLNEREKETGWVYRLPTAVEWEYACRGGPMADKADSRFDFYFARPTNTLLPKQANFSETELKRTCMVGSYPPNALGLYDLHGNVWEWCNDKHKTNTDVSARKILGACYLVGSVGCRTMNCARDATSLRYSGLGLRLARVPSGAPSPEVKTPPVAVAPFTDADVQRIAALPTAEQVEEVRKELMRRNPGFDGTVEHKIQGGVATEFKVVTEQVTDIAPLRVFNALRVLDCGGTPGTQGTPARKSQLADLTPLKGMNLTQLTHLHLRSTKVGDADMALFKDCKNLRHLSLYATPVSDAGLAHFNDCKGLVTLDLAHTRVTDAGLAGFRECAGLEVLYLSATKTGDAGLTHFKDCKNLRMLFLSATNATDSGLAHFKNCKKLGRLSIAGSKVTDLSLLKEMPLTELGFDFKPERDVEILRSIKTLVTINGKPVAQFWKDAEARQAEFKEWLQLVPTLTAEQQVAAVAARLKERNPGLDGTAGHKSEGGVVTELTFTPVKGRDVVTDLSPVRALAGLTYLNLWGCGGLEDLEPLRGMRLTRLTIGSFQVSTQVRDLEPLRGMKLTELSIYTCQVQDLEPLKDMPLTRLVLLSRQVRSCEPLKGMPLNVLNLSSCTQIQDFTPLQGLPLTGLYLQDCKVRDLEPFKGMKLTGLGLAGTPVRDLDLLEGMPLKTLFIQKTGVTDLRPVRGMELEEIYLTPKNITQGLDLLRDMGSLKKMGIEYNPSWEPKEFWERYDKGEFKK